MDTTLAPDQFISTLDQQARFLRPADPGRLVGRGRVVHRDGDLAFLEATLCDADDTVVATGTTTARVIAFGPDDRWQAAASRRFRQVG